MTVQLLWSVPRHARGLAGHAREGQRHHPLHRRNSFPARRRQVLWAGALPALRLHPDVPTPCAQNLHCFLLRPWASSPCVLWRSQPQESLALREFMWRTSSSMARWTWSGASRYTTLDLEAIPVTTGLSHLETRTGTGRACIGLVPQLRRHRRGVLAFVHTAQDHVYEQRRPCAHSLICFTSP